MFKFSSYSTPFDCGDLLSAVSSTLERGVYHIGFVPAVERIYQHEVRNRHRRRTLVICLFAVCAYYWLALPGLWVVDEGFPAVVIAALFAACLPTAAAIIWLFVWPLSPLRQPLMATVVVIFAICGNWMIGDAGPVAANTARFAMAVVVATANVVLALNFRVAAFCSLAVCLVTAAFGIPEFIAHWPKAATPVAFTAVIALLTLTANYRIETSSRLLFLLLLREKLRGEHMRSQNEALSRLSNSDALTGIANRRAFDNRFGEIWRHAREQKGPIALLLLDIDHFKTYNDTYGHQAGDDCLRRIAQAIVTATRNSSDLAARFGGEEFAVILPNGDHYTARAIAKRIHAVVASLAIPHAASPTHAFVSVSIGIAVAPHDEPIEQADLVARADRALYAAKASGRNRTGGDDRVAA